MSNGAVEGTLQQALKLGSRDAPEAFQMWREGQQSWEMEPQGTRSESQTWGEEAIVSGMEMEKWGGASGRGGQDLTQASWSLPTALWGSWEKDQKVGNSWPFGLQHHHPGLPVMAVWVRLRRSDWVRGIL